MVAVTGLRPRFRETRVARACSGPPGAAVPPLRTRRSSLRTGMNVHSLGGRDRMTCLKRALPAMILLGALAAPAAAQVGARPFEFSAGGGMFAYDTRARLKDGSSLTGSLGWRLAPWGTFEFSGTYGGTDSDTTRRTAKASFANVSADLRFNARPAEDKVVPFAIVGMGLGRSIVDRGVPEKRERGAPSLGAGALFN